MFDESVGMKAPVTYYGGKQKIAKRIVDLLPKHRRYVEPFAGGLAVFYAKPSAMSPDGEVVNDLDGRIANFWKQLRDNPDLVHRIEHTLHCKRTHSDAREAYASMVMGVDGAWAFWVMCMSSFAHQARSSASFARSKARPRTDAMALASKSALVATARDRMRGVVVESEDCIAVIRRYSTPGTLFYCDPPYPGTSHKWGWNTERQSELFDVLRWHPGPAVVSGYHASGDDARGFDKVFMGQIGDGMSRRNKGENGGTECIWIKVAS